jgi:hypothetical protein
MGILLAFSPFIAFAVADRLIDPTTGLWVGTLTSAALLGRDLLSSKRSPKILEIGTFLLFGGLATYALLSHPTGSVIAVRLLVDAGLLLIVLVSMAVGRPFTLQYAKEQVDPEMWNTHAFKHTNYVISAAWAVAFVVMILAEFAILQMPNLPQRLGVLVIVFALVGAVKFTSWYPGKVSKNEV